MKSRAIRIWFAVAVGVAHLCGAGMGRRQARAQDVLAISLAGTNVIVDLTCEEPGPQVGRVEAIEALGSGLWTPIHAETGKTIRLLDADFLLWPRRSYRSVRTVPPDIAPASAWTNRIELPGDPFLSPPAEGFATEVRWVKFALLMDDLTRVYFQNSNQYLFHYDFATNCLGPFAGKLPAEFDRETLYRDGQQAVLGAVLVAPERNEYAIQFVGQDIYPPQMVRFLFSLVDGSITKPAYHTGFYMPAVEQLGFAQNDKLYFESRGLPVASAARWTGRSGIYSEGWACGRLVYVPSADINPSYEAGLLLPSDILLTDIVPSEIPYLRGIISLSPSTPNSHVSLLARSYGVPFVYLDDSSLMDLANSSSNRTVLLRLRVHPASGASDVDIVVTASSLPSDVVDYLDWLKSPPVLDIEAAATFGRYSTNTAALTPDHVRYFGGKAANFGFLRRAIPANSPDAYAFSFDLWNDFMSQPAPTGGVSLAAYIGSRLSAHAYPPDMARFAADLQHIRDVIRYQCDFTPGQKSAITEALSAFDPARKVRFRSSTNVEDTETFSGAGMYDSYSASPSRPEDVYEAIRRVYASLYNCNAYLERLRYGIDETRVGMAVLFHYRYPDNDELANGVATYDAGGSFRETASVVSQPGAVSVTNPEGSGIPEIVSLVFTKSFGVFPTLEQRSSLLIPGVDTVMVWEDDYRNLGDLFTAVVGEYRNFYADKAAFVLDFEFKKMRNEGLSVKQVREVPGPSTAEVFPVLIGDTTRFRVFQGEYATVFDNHYLKSLWTFRTRSMILDATNRVVPWFAHTDFEYVSDGKTEILSGSITNWPAFSLTPADSAVTYGYTTTPSLGIVRHDLQVQLPPETTTAGDAICLLSDSTPQYSAAFPEGLPVVDYSGTATTASNFEVRLELYDPDVSTAGNLPQIRTVTRGAVSVRTEYWWPPHPGGVTAGYTAPLAAFKETRITGLTSAEIVLTGYYSQTYRPQHHNFAEDFLFEPGLDPRVSTETRIELEAANIKLILVQNTAIRIIGHDGRIRTL